MRASFPRVALLLASLEPGGAEQMYVRLAGEFAERGFAVDLVVLGQGTGALRQAVSSKVRVVALGCRRIRYSLMPLVAYFFRVRPRACYASSIDTNLIASIALAVSRVDALLFARVQTTFSLIAPRRKLFRRAFILLNRWLLGRASRVVAISEGVAMDLSRLGIVAEGKIAVIYNPAVREEFIGRRKKRKEITSRAEIKLLSVGRLVEAKDQATLLRAFRLVVKKAPARLVIAGEGPLREDLQGLASELGVADRVSMPGYLKDPFLEHLDADVFVLTSRREGFGNVVAEALAHGIPVVSTDCPSGPGEILQRGKFGRLVPVGDAVRVAGAVFESLEEPLIPDPSELRAYTSSEVTDKYLRLMELVGSGGLAED